MHSQSLFFSQFVDLGSKATAAELLPERGFLGRDSVDGMDSYTSELSPLGVIVVSYYTHIDTISVPDVLDKSMYACMQSSW